MTIRFCFYCGEGYNKDRWLDPFECYECGAQFNIPVTIRISQISLDEAQQRFDQIALTDKKALRAAKRKK